MYFFTMSKNYIKEIRQGRGLSQQQLADLLVPPASVATIHNLENGKRKLTQDWINKLAMAMECHKIDILEGPAAPRSSAEKALLEKFRGMEERDREMFSSLLDTYADKNARYTQNKKPENSEKDEKDKERKKDI